MINDPKVTEEVQKNFLMVKLNYQIKMFFLKNILKAAAKADAVIVFTNWDVYKIDWEEIYKK